MAGRSNDIQIANESEIIESLYQQLLKMWDSSINKFEKTAKGTTVKVAGMDIALDDQTQEIIDQLNKQIKTIEKQKGRVSQAVESLYSLKRTGKSANSYSLTDEQTKQIDKLVQETKEAGKKITAEEKNELELEYRLINQKDELIAKVKEFKLANDSAFTSDDVKQYYKDVIQLQKVMKELQTITGGSSNIKGAFSLDGLNLNDLLGEVKNQDWLSGTLTKGLDNEIDALQNRVQQKIQASMSKLNSTLTKNNISSSVKSDMKQIQQDIDSASTNIENRVDELVKGINSSLTILDSENLSDTAYEDADEKLEKYMTTLAKYKDVLNDNEAATNLLNDESLAGYINTDRFDTLKDTVIETNAKIISDTKETVAAYESSWDTVNLQSLQSTIEKLKEENNQLKESIASKDVNTGAYNELQEQLQKNEALVEALQLKIKELNGELSTSISYDIYNELVAQLERSKSSVRELETKLKELNNNSVDASAYNELQEQLEKSKSSVSELETELKELQEELGSSVPANMYTALFNQLEESKTTVGELEEKLKELNTNAVDVNTYNDLQEQLQKSKNEVEELKAEIKELNLELDMTISSDVYTDLKADIVYLEEEIAKLQSELKDSVSYDTYDELQEQLKKSEELVAELRTEISNLNTELSHSVSQNLYDDLQAQLEVNEKLVAELRTETERLYNDSQRSIDIDSYYELQEQLQKSEDSLSELRAELEKVNAESVNINAYNELQEQLKESGNLVTELESKVQQLNDAMGASNTAEKFTEQNNEIIQSNKEVIESNKEKANSFDSTTAVSDTNANNPDDEYYQNLQDNVKKSESAIQSMIETYKQEGDVSGQIAKGVMADEQKKQEAKKETSQVSSDKAIKNYAEENAAAEKNASEVVEAEQKKQEAYKETEAALKDAANSSVNTTSQSYDNGSQSTGSSTTSEKKSLEELNSKLAEVTQSVNNKTESFEREQIIVETATASERNSIDTLIVKIKEVVDEVDKKSQAFKDEQQVVDGVVQSEISNLEVLDSQLLEIKQTLEEVQNSGKTTGNDSSLLSYLDSILSKADELNNLATVLTNLNDTTKTGLNNNGISNEQSDLFDSYYKGIENLQKISSKSFKNLNVDSFINSLEDVNAKFKEIQDLYSDGIINKNAFSKSQNELKSFVNEMSSTLDSISLDGMSQAYIDQYEEAQKKIQTIQSNVTSTGVIDQKTVDLMREYLSLVKDLSSASTISSNKLVNTDSIDKLIKKINSLKDADLGTNFLGDQSGNIGKINELINRIEQLRSESNITKDALKGFNSEFENLQKETKGYSNEIKEFYSSLSELKKTLSDSFKTDNFDFSGIQTSLNEIIQKYKSIQDLNKNGFISDDAFGNIKESLDYLDSYIESISKINGQDLMNFDTSAYKQGTEFLENIQKAQTELTEVKSIMSNISLKEAFTDDDLKKLQNYVESMRELQTAAKDANNALGNQKSSSKLLSNIYEILNKNTAMSKELRQEFEALAESIKLAGDNASALELDDFSSQFLKLRAEMNETGQTGKSFFDGITKRATSMSQSFIAMYFSLYDFIRYFRTGIGYIQDFDTALTEMRKVSDETTESLKAFQQESFDIADAVGTTAVEIQNSTADWMRLGESLEEAAESAEAANILMNVSEFDSIDEATESLVAMSAAYSDLDKMDIIDSLNEVGNNYSISTDELATALQSSASALVTAGNDMDEAVALITAGNAVVQDADKVGAGMRTIALRITGTEEAKEELEELGEDTDDFVIATSSKMQETIKDFTRVASNNFQGFDILDDNGNYKSTYEIMLGIAQIYDEIVETDQKYGSNMANGLLETLAGKRFCLKYVETRIYRTHLIALIA